MESAPLRADPAGPRARLYLVGDPGLELIAELRPSARDGAPLLFEESAAAAGFQPGDMLLFIFQDGRIEKVGRLSPYLKRVDANEKEDKEDTGDDADDDEEDQSFVRQLNVDDSSEEVTSDEEVASLRYSIKLRLWASHAVLVLHYGNLWKLTRQHPVHWLKLTDIEKTARSLIDNDEIHKARTKAFSSWPKESTTAFEGLLECSAAAIFFVNTELTPHVDDFRFIKVLGITSDCKVYSCSYLDDSLGDVQFALKKMQITDEFDDEDAIDYQEPREVTIFSSLEDSRIVIFIQAWACDGLYKTYLEDSDSEEYDLCEDGPDPRYVIIQMNVCSRTLDTLLSIGKSQVMDVEVAWIIFTEITKAVKYMHQNGVIHRDLKPGNIFFPSPDTYKVMIGDFGHSCWSKNYVDGKEGTPFRGTPLYSAPELKMTSDLTEKADIYSIGVILAELFHSFSTGKHKCEVLGGLSKGMHPTEWGGDTVLLKRLTALTPSDRPSAVEILDYLANRQ